MPADPYKYFRVEARDLLEQLNRAVLDFERGAGPAQVVPVLMRHAHTLKGAARIVRRVDIAEIAHALEDSLEPHRRATEWTNAEGLAQELTGYLGKVAAILETLRLPPSVEIGVVGEPAKPSALEGERSTTIRAEAEQVEALVAVLTQAVAEQHAFEQFARAAADDACLSAERLIEQMTTRAAARIFGQRFLDEAEALVVMLKRLQSGLRASADRASRELETALSQARELRLQPADTIFAGLEQSLRDAARSAGKRVALKTTGGSETVDARLLERLRGVLVQVVGNAVVHGVEAPEERRALGKPETATVWLEVERGRDTVTVRCRDDGRGANLGAIRRRLAERGMAVPQNEQELLDSLLQDGVTTAPGVDGLAGRGVGLAAAQTVASDLGGRLALRSEAGTSFTVELTLPSTLRIVDCLDVEAGDVSACVPVSSIVRTQLLDDAVLTSISTTGGLPEGAVVLPVVLLEDVVGLEIAPGPRRVAVIVRTGSGVVAVLAQRLGQRRRSVLNRIPPAARVPRRFLGAVFDATGRPRIVLDAESIVASRSAFEVAASPKSPPRVLVVDDSLTTRMLEQSILEAHGYEVDLAESAEEGMRKAEKQRYHLYLVDVEMSGADGFWFVAQTRANAKLRNTPAVLVSSRSSAEDVARGVSVGAAGYIVKGRFDQAEFLALVGRLTEVSP